MIRYIAAFTFGCMALASSSHAIVLPTGPNCPSVFQAYICSQDDISVSGSNRCFAIDALQKQLARHGIAYDPQAVDCYNAEVAAAPAVERRPPPPVCGIIPTVTTCSVTVSDRFFEITVTDCDRPIPALRAKLQRAGIDSDETTGLVVTCTREQLGHESTYTIVL